MIIIKKYQELIDCVIPYLSPCPIIVEAGAFNGADTLRLANSFTNAQIHAFEPLPDAYTRLVNATHHLSSITTYPVALGNRSGTQLFYVSEKPGKPGIPTQAGSLLKPYKRLALSPITFPTTIEVPTLTLDDWADQHHITSIDFLWLDMQGYELPMLQAAPRMLATVRAIYTEVGFCEAYAGQPTYQVVTAWLQGQGFTAIARDFQTETEHFFGNVLFVRSSLPR